MSTLRQQVTAVLRHKALFALLWAVLGGLSTFTVRTVRITLAVRAEAKEFVRELAAEAVKPVKADLDAHLRDMADKRVQMDVLGGQLVGAIGALCEDASPATTRKCLQILRPQIRPH